MVSENLSLFKAVMKFNYCAYYLSLYLRCDRFQSVLSSLSGFHAFV